MCEGVRDNVCEGKGTPGKPRMEILVCMMDQVVKMNYGEVEGKAMYWQEWQLWNPGPV